DIELIKKTLNIGEPAIGQKVQFRIEAQNRGPFEVPAGQFTISDVLFTGTPLVTSPPSSQKPAYEIIGASATGMDCTLTPGANELTTVSCVNHAAVPSGATRTMLIDVRLKKPVLDSSHVANSKLYEDAVNTADVA